MGDKAAIANSTIQYSRVLKRLRQSRQSQHISDMRTITVQPQQSSHDYS
jgi:hypothetical protein